MIYQQNNIIYLHKDMIYLQNNVIYLQQHMTYLHRTQKTPTHMHQLYKEHDAELGKCQYRYI